MRTALRMVTRNSSLFCDGLKVFNTYMASYLVKIGPPLEWLDKVLLAK
jgi:hypothetical protein